MPSSQKPPFKMLSRLNWAIVVGAGILLIFTVLSLSASFLPGLDPMHIRPRFRLKPPNTELWFGTDALGRDVFSRVLYGGQTSLLVGAMAALVGALCGTAIGLLAGASRWLDAIIMRIMDGVMAIPALLLAIAMVSLLRPSLFTIVAAIAFAETPRVTRLVRSVVLTVREETFVQAAEGLGLPRRIILFRHILPSCIGPLTVQTTYMFASAILFEAVLGFLGVGFPPDVPSWGNILAEGRSVFERAPWTIVFPGLFLAATVLAVNLFGDGLRDRLDPRLSRMAKVAS